MLNLVKLAGRGKKGATWKVIDRFGQEFALKIVEKQSYKTYSIQSELYRIRKLPSLFARVHGYGDLSSKHDQQGLLSVCYGVLEEWVEGITLKLFIEQGGDGLDVSQFKLIVSMLCEGVAALKRNGLCHNDLHDENILISNNIGGPRQITEKVLRIIDCGAMTSRAKKDSMLGLWKTQLTAIGSVIHALESAEQQELQRHFVWFSREDCDYLTLHICSLVNVLLVRAHALPTAERRFLDNVEQVLKRMTDHDVSRRLDDPGEVYADIELQWKRAAAPEEPPMLTPFDYISAELIRNDLQLNDLFSDKCPWFEACATTDPIYLYGPRGCGKSTILRKLSLRSVLSRRDAAECFDRQPFIGVYLSCSSELRSRFWLFKDNFFDSIQGDAVLFFSLLLIESLLETLSLLEDGAVQKRIARSVGLTSDTGYQIAKVVFERIGIESGSIKLQGISWIDFARKQVTLNRGRVWKRILENPQASQPDASLVFDICKELERIFPLLGSKHIAFLIDDYSNQRIPVVLQRMLNQTISFSKHGNPIFKVSSEFRGLDLDGIQEGREVNEVNLGREYVELSDRERSGFLEDILNKRFQLAKTALKVDSFLGRSGVSSGVPMARAIRDQFKSRETKFYYHGIDTISDICSGDIAMAIDLVKQIFIQAKELGGLSRPVSAQAQHEVIKRYSDREHVYLRYFANFGHEISRIVDALCKLAHNAAVHSTSIKDRKAEPMIKTHLDISDRAVIGLSAKFRGMLDEMERKGVLFSLDTSRSRIANAGTERFQVRRILLVKHIAPLGRRDPIKFDDEQRLVYLLTEPEEFIQQELSGQGNFQFTRAID